MALPGDICVGEHSVCLVRAALLGPDCTPLGGSDNGLITTGIVTATASPELIEGASFEPQTGCGDIAWTFEQRDKIRRYNLTGELTYFDHEAMALLFGGDVVIGEAATPFAGDTIGWAAPWYTDDEEPADVYIEFIVKTAGAGVGQCSDPEDPFPSYVGHIFPKATLTPGDRTYEFDAATLAFTGFAVNNPNAGDGPWNDWPGVGDIPNSGYVTVSYDADQYEEMLDLATCGWQAVPSQTP